MPLVDPLAELICNRRNDDDPAETALIVLSMTSENMWPPLDPLPKIFAGSRWQTRAAIRDGIWPAMERAFPSHRKGSTKAQFDAHHDVIDRLSVQTHTMILMRHDENKSPHWGGPSEVGQMVHALDKLLGHLPKGLVKDAITTYLKTVK